MNSTPGLITIANFILLLWGGYMGYKKNKVKEQNDALDRKDKEIAAIKEELAEKNREIDKIKIDRDNQLDKLRKKMDKELDYVQEQVEKQRVEKRTKLDSEDKRINAIRDFDDEKIKKLRNDNIDLSEKFKAAKLENIDIKNENIKLKRELEQSTADKKAIIKKYMRYNNEKSKR